MKHFWKRTNSIAVVFLTTATLTWAKAPSLTATLEPAEIALGEAAQLTVAVSGRDVAEPQIPAASGLEIQPLGQSSRIQVINGAMSANVSYTYAVTPTQPGNFIIPAIKLGQSANAAMARPIGLRVAPRAGGWAGSNQSGQNQLPAPTVNADQGQLNGAEQRSFGFLRLVAPQQEFYVGERVPVELKAYFRDGVELRLDGLPKLNSDAFTMNKLGDQPITSEQLINGVRYSVFTWPTAITAVKAGDYELSVELPTTVTVRQPARRRPMGDPFGDDIFDQVFNNFFGAATQKQVALNSPPRAVKILSLPTENRPESFTGAVGQFELSADPTPAQSAAGDPVKIKVRITGTGNFDRVMMPELEKSAAWKTYPPSARFEPDDSAGHSGTKIFEQAIVPTQSGNLQIPALAFSYFDPERKQYVTRTTTAASITVAPGRVNAMVASADTSLTSADASTADASGLKPNKVSPGHFTATLRPWFANPWRIVVALLPSMAVGLAYGLIRRRQNRTRDPRQVRAANARRALRLQLQTMERAAAQGDSGNFFAAACAAFQNLLGLRWSLLPRTITLAEIDARLNGEADGLRTIFGLANEAIYTGRSFAPDELRRLQALVNQEIRKLEAP